MSDDAAQLSKYPVLVSLEQRSQVPKAYAFIGAVTLLFPCFTLSMPSPRLSPTLSGGVFPPISLSRPSSHPVTTMTRSGSRIGSFSAFSILPRASPSVHYSIISRGIFRSRHCSFFGCNFPRSASVSLIIPFSILILYRVLGCSNGLLQCTAARPRT